jgi:hypothetical protein
MLQWLEDNERGIEYNPDEAAEEEQQEPAEE